MSGATAGTPAAPRASLPRRPPPRRPADGSGERAPRRAIRLRAFRPSCVGFPPDCAYAGGGPDAHAPVPIVADGARPARMIAGAVYGGVLQAIDRLFFAGLSATIVLYRIVNFHHCIVDALIRKTRRPASARVPVPAS